MFADMDRRRGPLETIWRDLEENFLPNKSRFLHSRVDKLDLRKAHIINAVPLLAPRACGEGMNAGITSQSRPMFGLTTLDQKTADSGAVKQWLHDTARTLHGVLGTRSNFHDVMPAMFKDACVYATAVVGVNEVEKDPDGGGARLHFEHYPIGSFWLGNDFMGRVRVFFRRFQMTVRQVLQQFGKREADGKYKKDNLSQHVCDAYEHGRLEELIDVCHIIYPNDQYNSESLFAKNKRYASVYYEGGGSSGSATPYLARGGPDWDKYLSESGYDYFPILAFRWEVNGEDCYGSSCPGMLALGDAKGLQKMERESHKGLEKKVTPPMNAPFSMRNHKLTTLPGQVTFLPGGAGEAGFTPTYQTDFKTNELDPKILAYEDRINEAFYKQIFMQLMTRRGVQPLTKEEVLKIDEEKFVALGSVLERANKDVINPVVDITFDWALRHALLPPAPPELEGLDLKVEYLSILAQAQRQIATKGSIDYAMFMMNFANVFPSARAKYNVDQVVEDVADSLGVNPNQVNDDEETAAIREQEMQAAQAARQAEAMAAAKQGASAAKDLSQATLDGNSALTALTGALAGAA